MNEGYEWIRDNSLVKGSVAIRLCNNIGYQITPANFVKLVQRGKGPTVTWFEGGKYFRIADIRTFIERRIKMTIRQAVERGRLHVPPELGQLRWDTDHTPVGRV